MNQVAHYTRYPVVCTQCGKSTAYTAATLLEKKAATCRHCQAKTTLKESQLNSLRRTLADLSDYLVFSEKKEATAEAE